MPTYEYRCADGHRFERVQRMSDDPIRSCPECGAESERLLSAGAGFLFRGDGFYITDYRSEDYRKAARAESGGGGDGSNGDKPASGSDKAAPKEVPAPASGTEGLGGSPEAGKAAAGAKSTEAASPAPTRSPSTASGSDRSSG